MKLDARFQIKASKELCERSFYHFVKEAWEHVDPKPFRDAWFIEVLCDHLQAVEEGRIQNLLITIPPGTAKSLISSVMFPAWLWVRDPSKRIISTSHSQKLSTRDARKSRMLIASEWFQARWQIKMTGDQNAKSAYENTAKGFREALPFGSTTGGRGNLVIVDDPHSVKTAKSDAERLTAVENFLEAIPSRLNDQENDSIIVIQQRLHEYDVAGTIISRPDLGYTHLNLPMIAVADKSPPTTLGWIDPRKAGETLHPERFSDDVIKRLRASLGTYAFSGQYQQDPVPMDDGFFRRDWFQIYRPEERPQNLRYYLTSDHAPGGGLQNDYNVLRVWGIDQNKHLWLVDSFRKQCRLDELVGFQQGSDKRMKLTSVGIMPFIKKYKISAWFPENDGSFKTLESLVLNAMRETGIRCRIEALSTKGSKVAKAEGYQALASQHMVHLPLGQIADDAIIEYVKFPMGRNDDQVDADALIARAINEIRGAVIPPKAAEPVALDPYSVIQSAQLSDSDSFWAL